MKKVIYFAVVALVVGGAWYLQNSDTNKPADKSTAATGSAASSSSGSNANSVAGSQQSGTTSGASSVNTQGNANAAVSNDAEDEEDGEIKPGWQVYKSAEEALEAIKKGSTSYDDDILQQFVQLGDDCTWCDSLYGSLRDLLKDSGQSADQKGYFGEILAMSGKVENIKALVAQIGHTESQQEKEALAESLELTLGGDDVVKFLSEYMENPDSTLKEAAVAAISNQGSRLAAESLYKNAVDSKNTDGYYSMGIGLGEFVPDEESYGFLQDQVIKKDEYSHLAVKALINAGLPGITMVIDVLSNSTDENDKSLLKDAVDHVSYDEDTKAYFQKVAARPQTPAFIKEFIDSVLKEFKDIEEEE